MSTIFCLRNPFLLLDAHMIERKKGSISILTKSAKLVNGRYMEAEIWQAKARQKIQLIQVAKHSKWNCRVVKAVIMAEERRYIKSFKSFTSS